MSKATGKTRAKTPHVTKELEVPRSSTPSPTAQIRLNRFIAMAGVTSRRKADELIEAGKVAVNGKPVVDLGTKINPALDKVFVDGKQVVILDDPVYIVLNKPKDCITTVSDEKGRATVLDLVKVRERIFPIGRLDRETTGVLLLTNDGEFANGLMHPRNEIEKAYEATLDKILEPEDQKKLTAGIRLSDGVTAPAEIHVMGKGKNQAIGIVIREGRNRQIHRMFEALGYEVKKLDRVGYGDLTYEGLPRGAWRYLTAHELRKLREKF